MNYKINKKVLIANAITILTIIVFIPILKPTYFNTLNYMTPIYKFLKLISYIMLLKYFIKKKNKNISIVMILIIIFYLELGIVTILKTNNIAKFINNCIPILLICLFFDSIEKEKIKYVLKGLVFIYSILTYINLMSVIFFPNGLYSGSSSVENYYFLGHNNSAIKILLPGIFFSGIYDYLELNKLRLRTKLLALSTMITVTLTWSNTAMVGCGVILIYIFFIDKIKIKKTINFITLSAIPMVLFIFIVFYRKFEMFSYFIVNVLKKDLNLTGRVKAWDAIIPKILEAPIWGYGYGNNIWEIVDMGKLKPSSCHNYFLDLIFQGGIVQLAIVMLMIGIISKKICNKKNAMNQFAIFTLLAYFIMWQFEPYINTGALGIFLVFILSYKVSEEVKISDLSE